MSVTVVKKLCVLSGIQRFLKTGLFDSGNCPLFGRTNEYIPYGYVYGMYSLVELTSAPPVTN